MELKFNNMDEIVDFLKELGYTVEKQDFSIKQVTEEEAKEKKEEMEDWWKKLPQNPYPYNPYSPYTPWYPNYPIVTYEAMSDPNLSTKFGTCKK